ncbi:MAG TPA: CHASE3 domain-containing protein [Ideonella sp.]|nr:CHASE3 domain-containing protein [Ideonella sp.]
MRDTITTITTLSDRLRRSAFAFPLAVLVAGLMMAISEFAYHEADAQLKRLSLIVQVRLEITRVLRRITDAESGQRGYLLTSRPEYLIPYRDSGRDVQDGLARLQDMYRRLEDPVSQAKLKPMAADLSTKLSELEEVIALHDSGRDQAANALMMSGIGRDRMDTIRRQADELLAHETSRIAVGTENVLDTLMLGRIGVAAMTTVSLLVLAMFLRQSRQLDRERADQASMLRAERDRLELQVLTRTAELTELARHLQTAREDERARLARDLHDELGALLTAAKLDVARIRPKLQQVTPDLLPRVAHLIDTLNSGIALKRRIIEDLRPSTLDSLGLLPALEVLCQESAERLAVPVVTRFAPVSLTRSAELTVFRLVQESLSNIAKYAQATRVDVQLEDLGDEACVTVIDNGIGFRPDQVEAARHGLVGMRYRVEAEQGAFSVESRPGHGTTLRARLPQSAREDDGRSADIVAK